MKNIDFKSLDKRINDLFAILETDDENSLGIIVQDPSTKKFKIDFTNRKDKRIKAEFETNQQATEELKRLKCGHIINIVVLE